MAGRSPCSSCLKHNEKGKGRARDLVLPENNAASAQGKLWHHPSVPCQVRSTLGPTATGSKREAMPQQRQRSVLAALLSWLTQNKVLSHLVRAQCRAQGNFAASHQHTFLLSLLHSALPFTQGSWRPSPLCPASVRIVAHWFRDPEERKRETSSVRTLSLFLKITRLERGQTPPLPYSIRQGLISKLFSATIKIRNLRFQ